MRQPIPIYEGHSVEGKMKMLEREKAAMRRWVATFRAGARLDITIRKHSEKRTSDQNRYYWGTVVAILADHFGHDNAEDMHTDLKEKFNPVESKIEPGKMIGGTTTALSTVDFFCAEDSYVERICRWAAMEHSVFIPPPKKAD